MPLLRRIVLDLGAAGKLSVFRVGDPSYELS